MYKYLIKYLCLLTLFLFGCSTSSNQKVVTVDRIDTKLLEKRVNDLSDTITFIVNDTNRLHNGMDEIETSNKAIQQKIEGIEVTLQHLNEQIVRLTTAPKTADVIHLPGKEVIVKPPVSGIASDKFPDESEPDIQMEEGFQKGVEKTGRMVADGMQNDSQKSIQTDEGKSDITLIEQQSAIIDKNSVQIRIEDTPKGIQETIQISETKSDIILSKQETSVTGEQANVESVQGDIRETAQMSDVKSEVTPVKQDVATTNEMSGQARVENIQKDAEGTMQTIGSKSDVPLPKQEETAASEINEQAKRELFLKDNIARLAESEFSDKKGIRWNILSFEHKAHLTHVEVEPAPASLDYPRLKFIISFKNPEMPRVIGMLGLKGGQYILFSTKKW